MTKKNPQLFCYNIDTIKEKINNIMKLGYTKVNANQIVRVNPGIFLYSIENIRRKIKDIMSLGYSSDEVLKIILGFPQILDLSKENISEKITFYDSINFHNIAVVSPKQLIQSPRLSYARLCFYKEKGLPITMDNYRKLFIGGVQFEKKYGINNTKLLKQYNYDKYKEELKGGRTS